MRKNKSKMTFLNNINNNVYNNFHSRFFYLSKRLDHPIQISTLAKLPQRSHPFNREQLED